MTFPNADASHATEMRFAFDPPFALPGAGEYFFAVQDYCGAPTDFLVVTRDAYTKGDLWRTSITCPDGLPVSGAIHLIIFRLMIWSSR